MAKLIHHELTKLFLFIVISFLGAAALAPVLYSAGKNLAAEAAVNDLSPLMEWLAVKCERAEFSRYFNRALMAVAIILLYPLVRSLRSRDSKSIKPPLRQRINPRAQGWKDIAVGLLLSAGFLTLLACLLFQLSWIEWDSPLKVAKSFQKAIIPAIIVSLLEEWLFRGVLFDVLRRQLSVLQTTISLSLFFAAVHFLNPPKGADVSDGFHPLAGFEMLGLIGQKFLSPASFFGVFMTLFVVGAILAYARHKTGYLWLAIGLHSGWIFSLKMMNGLTDATGNAPELWFNDNITDGLLPLITLLITGGCVHLYLKKAKTSL